MPDKNLEEYARGLLELDDEANGIYMLPIDKDSPKYDIQALDRYCKERNIDTSALTNKELEKFKVRLKMLG